VTIAAIDDDSYDETTLEDLEEPMTPRTEARVAMFYDSNDPRHPDAWQKGIFPS
jgi:hypothetical protein